MQGSQGRSSQPSTGPTTRKPRATPMDVENERAMISRALKKAGQISSDTGTAISSSITEFVMAETGLASETIVARKKNCEKTKIAWENSKRFFRYRNATSCKHLSDDASSIISAGFAAEGDFQSIATGLSTCTNQAPEIQKIQKNGKIVSSSKRYDLRSQQSTCNQSVIMDDNDSVISNLTEAIDQPDINGHQSKENNNVQSSNQIEDDIGPFSANYSDDGSIYTPSSHSEYTPPDPTRVQNLENPNISTMVSHTDTFDIPFSSTANIDNYQIQTENYIGSQTGHDNIEVSGTQSSTPNQTNSLDKTTFEDIAQILAKAPPSMRFIPGNALTTFRDTMTHTLQQIINGIRHNNKKSLMAHLKQFLLIPAYVLSVQKGRNFQQEVLKRLSNIQNDKWNLDVMKQPPRKASKASKLTRAANQIGNGSISKAYRTLTNNLEMTLTELEHQRLQDLFPTGQQPTQDRLRDKEVGDVAFATQDILFHIRNLKKDKSPGLTQLRGEHLQQLILDAKPQQEHPFTSALTTFLGMLVNNQVPEEFGKVFFSGYLIPFKDLDTGKIRPIVMTETLRKVIGKVIMDQSQDTIQDLFGSSQFGVGTPCGTEKILHRINLQLQSQPTLDMIQIDFRNAFNTVSREQVLDQVKMHLQEWYPYVQASYGKPVKLYMNLVGSQSAATISSIEGVHQGDSIGPLLFCLAIQAKVNQIVSHYTDISTHGYMDDLTFVGPRSQLQPLLLDICNEFPSIGLQVNPAKCIALLALDSEDQDQATRDYNNVCNGIKVKGSQVMIEYGTTLLGTPIGSKEFVEAQLHKTMDALEEEFNKVKVIKNSQHMWAFLHFVLKSKLNHLFRTLPPQCTKTLAKRMQSYIFDNFKERFEIPNISEDMAKQLHANFGKGGFNIPEYEHVAIAAFLASILNSVTALTEDKKDLAQLLTSNVPLTKCIYDAIKAYANRSKQYERTKNMDQQELAKDFQSQFVQHPRNTQRAILSKIRKTNGKYKIKKPPDDDHHASAWYASVTQQYAGAALSAVPSQKLQMSDAQFKIFVRLRLREPLPGISRNTRCLCKSGCKLDVYGNHLLGCKDGPFKIYRHNHFKECTQSLARLAGFCVIDEDRRLNNIPSQANNRAKQIIPDFTISSTTSPQVAYDVTIIQPQTGPNANNIDLAEKKKIRKYTAALDHHNVAFTPLVADVYGQLSKHTITFVKRMSRLIAEKNGGSSSVIANFYFCKLSIIIQSGNADLILDKINRLYYNKPNGPVSSSHVMRPRGEVRNDFNPLLHDAREN